MTAMPHTPARVRPWLLWVAAGWVVLALAAWLYASRMAFPAWAAFPLAAAFLIEFPFYLLPAFEGPRVWLARQPKSLAALLIAASAIAPWCVFSFATGQAHPENLGLLIAV